MVISLGGLAQKQMLVALGATDRMLTSAVRTGSVHRARQGWYSVIPENDPVLRAARVGGRLAGLSALRYRGAWVWDDGPLHVAIPRNASRLRNQWNRFTLMEQAAAEGVVLHWDDSLEGGDLHSVDVKTALVGIVLDEPFETAVIAFDWALRTGVLDRIAYEEVLLALPSEARMIRHWVDGRSDSILESISRIWLQLRGFRVTSQVPVGDLESIDLVVEDVVALETDGRDHVERFESDRRKDVSITIENRHPLRPTYSMVRFEFDRLVQAIEAAIRARTAGWSVENSGGGASPTVLGRRNWRLLDGSVTRIPEFPPGRGGRPWARE